jgi:hypothetical protein
VLKSKKQKAKSKKKDNSLGILDDCLSNFYFWLVQSRDWIDTPRQSRHEDS